MIAKDTLSSAATQPDSVAQDTLAVVPMRVVSAFPDSELALFGGSNPYAAKGLEGVARAELAGAGRVFAARGKLSHYAVRGGYALQGEVAIPRPAARVSAAVGGVTLGVLLLFFLLFVLLRRHIWLYYHRYINLRFFSTASARGVATAVPMSGGFRAVGDTAWPMLVGFLLWRGLWLQWAVRTSDAQSLLWLLACMMGFLLLTGLRYLALGAAEYLTNVTDLRWNIWENVQVPMRAFWPLLLVGAVLTVYVVPFFQWYALLAMVGVVCVGWVLRIYRMAKAFRWQGYGRLYFFLYLCGVEIMLPMLAMRLAEAYL